MSNNNTKKPILTLTPSGPMIVRGPVEIIGPDGKPVKLDPHKLRLGVVLCMCGRSSLMPFCDGSHIKG